MLANKSNVPVPDEVAKEMRLWRLGLGDCQKFMAFHKKLAEERLEILAKSYCLRVHNTYMCFDGWGDGVQFLHAVIETPKGKLMKLKWHEGNQGFMEKYKSGGVGALTAEDVQ